MKKLYRICNPENPIEREETLLIFRTEARFELSLTTRAKSLKTAYEKFLRAFNEACADGAIDADLARDIKQWIEPRPYTKLIETLPHDDKPRRLSFDDDLSVFVGEVKDADGNFIGKWTYEEFGDDDGFYLLFMLQLAARNADDRLTAAQFSEKTQINRNTLRRWHHEGKFIPAVVQDGTRPNFYSVEQIQQAIDLRESLRQSKPTAADDNQVSLFEEATTMNQDESKLNNVVQFEHTEQAIVPAELSAPVENSAEPAQVVTLDDRARRIRQLQADVQRGIIEIGFELIEAKKEIGHGNWAQWLEKEFEWTPRTAQYFMKMATRFGKTNTYSFLRPSTLKAMLALPAGTEQEFIDEQKAQGKPVETQSARQIQNAVKDFNQRNKQTAVDEPPRPAFIEVDDDENKLGLRLTAEPSPPQIEVLPADNPAAVTNDEPEIIPADEYDTPLDSMRDFARQIFEEIISEADVSTLNAVLKDLSRIRDNLRGLDGKKN